MTLCTFIYKILNTFIVKFYTYFTNHLSKIDFVYFTKMIQKILLHCLYLLRQF
jgi:hypothetical protein